MKKPFIIGITGSFGKTSCAYTLLQYFTQLGLSTSLLSSNKSVLKNQVNKLFVNNFDSEERLNYYINEAKNDDILIIEVNEASLAKNIYTNVHFDCKVLTSFVGDFSFHREKTDYQLLKQQFFNQGECLRVINKHIDNYQDFQSSDAVVFSTELNDICDIYPIAQSFKFKDSSCVLMIKDQQHVINTTLEKDGYKNLITVISVLCALEMFDEESFITNYVLTNHTIPGRHQQKEINQRHIIIDSGNGKSLRNFCKETEDIKNYKIKGLLSTATGLDDYTYDRLIQNGFVSLNKYLVSDPIVRKHCFVFGGNLYKAYHKLQNFPTNDPTFDGAIDEIGYNPLLDFSNIDTSKLPLSLVENMISITKEIGIKEGRTNDSYSKNMWWRSIPTIKGAFTIFYQEFMQVYDWFKTLNNDDLNASCDFVKQMIDYSCQQYRQLGDAFSDLNVDQLYLTTNNNSTIWNDSLELRMYKAFFKQDIKIFTNRQEAIDCMVKESEENDILYIAGRGDEVMYRKEDSVDYITDEEYVIQAFERGKELC